jgi:hypothetical protein
MQLCGVRLIAGDGVHPLLDDESNGWVWHKREGCWVIDNKHWQTPLDAKMPASPNGTGGRWVEGRNGLLALESYSFRLTCFQPSRPARRKITATASLRARARMVTHTTNAPSFSNAREPRVTPIRGRNMDGLSGC